MTLQDLLYLSGGIKQSAEFGRLEISSIVDIDSAKRGLKPTRTVVKSYGIQSDLQLDSASSLVKLKPYDQVFVRKNPTFELQQNILLKGLIKYEGYYPRLNNYERLSSFIDRAGGLKENANVSGAVLFRNKTDLLRENVVEKVKLDSTGGLSKVDSAIQANSSNVKAGMNSNEPVSIDLYKALKYRNSKYDIVLREKDVIFIPEINPFVTVQGRVQAPLKITFDKEHTNLSYYIDKAGGFGIRPWRKRIYVTYANGRSKRTRSFGFFNFYPRVEEGSTVIVPERPKGQEVGEVIKSALVATIPIILTTILLKNIN
jgi:protein involved in polysaccharide export with SLBB domain